MIISLDAYIVRVREARKTKARPLGLYDGRGPLISRIHRYLRELSTKYIAINAIHRSVKVENLSLNGDELRGLMLVGHFGFSGDIIDTSTGQTVYQKKKTDADPIPYFFSLKLPPNEDKGVLVLQRTGLGGIKNLFDLLIVGQFIRDHNGLVMDINPLAPQEVLRDYIARGRIEHVKLIRHSIASDIADQFGGVTNEEEGVVELTIRPKKKSFFDKQGLLEVVDGERDINSLYRFHAFDYDSVEAKVTVDGVARTFDVVQPKRFRASVNITRDVVVGSNGHPDYNSLVSISDSVIRGMARKAGIVL
ncbi:hypothetical protein [Azospirillum himalayense]|uniref:Uncharacterized protein n=1 Tax=Azospirillum himalayense TaxID=654847 RepID=A0ABW0GCN3_9PROT